ncbi:helix-turn-helix transcriptional regulator [Streptomyces daliensis]
MRSVRRAAEKTQAEVAEALGVAGTTVVGWESGAAEPDQEKLPQLAQVLGRDLDDIFPRFGRPDLTDLRCDAGLYRYETAAVIGTKSDGPVAGAEKGERKLKERYIPALAQAYGVTEDELTRAQDRSMARTQGQDEDEAEAAPAAGEEPPRTLTEKIAFLLDRSYPGQQPPGDAEIADGVNAHAGSQVVTAKGIEELRTGTEEDAPLIVRQGLANFFGVTPLYFEPSEAVVRQVYEGLRLMSAANKGKVGRVRGRGLGAEGLPPGVLSILNDLADELDKADPDSNG